MTPLRWLLVSLGVVVIVALVGFNQWWQPTQRAAVCLESARATLPGLTQQLIRLRSTGRVLGQAQPASQYQRLVIENSDATISAADNATLGGTGLAIQSAALVVAPDLPPVIIPWGDVQLCRRVMTSDNGVFLLAANTAATFQTVMRYQDLVTRASLDLLAVEPRSLFGGLSAGNAGQRDEVVLRARSTQRLLQVASERLNVVVAPAQVEGFQDRWIRDIDQTADAAGRIVSLAGTDPAAADRLAADVTARVLGIQQRMVSEQARLWANQTVLLDPIVTAIEARSRALAGS